jgi:uncharacterized protein YdhG (YjbR/CyaY superfamily)
MKSKQKTVEGAAAIEETSRTWTDEERAAMKERAREMKSSARRSTRDRAAEEESEALAKIAEMPESDRVMAERLHAAIKASVPALSSTTWYGMPAWARDGKIICHFQAARKFKTRYATFGFSDAAHLDDGAVWPVAYALTTLTADDAARILALVKQAVS